MNKSVSTLAALAAVAAFGLAQQAAASVTFTGTGTNSVTGTGLAASATFDIIGTNLLVTLTNTAATDVLAPSDVLTAVFFNIPTPPGLTLTPVSALLSSGSTVFFGSDGGGNVGGEWAYGAAVLAGAPSGANAGISSSGLGLVGAGNFNGSNLGGPINGAVDGLQYGITSAGDNTASGNAAVTGGNELIKNSVDFVLAIGGTGTFSLSDIGSVSFQYGTALTEPNIPGGCTPGSPGCGGGGGGGGAPEPATLALVALGLLGAGAARHRRRQV